MTLRVDLIGRQAQHLPASQPTSYHVFAQTPNLIKPVLRLPVHPPDQFLPRFCLVQRLAAGEFGPDLAHWIDTSQPAGRQPCQDAPRTGTTDALDGRLSPVVHTRSTPPRLPVAIGCCAWTPNCAGGDCLCVAPCSMAEWASCPTCAIRPMLAARLPEQKGYGTIYLQE